MDRREAGQVDRAAGAAGLDRQQQGREDDDRRHQLRAAEGLPDRAHARARATTRSVGRQRRSRLDRPPARRRPRSSSSRWWPVLATKTSSRRRLDQLERLDLDPGLVERPDDRRDLGGAALELDQHASPSLRGQRLAEAAPRPPRPRSALPSISLSSRWGWPISPSARPGVPSATIRPLSMIPTRSASWSASSRYWVVRKTVVPSSLSVRDLLPDRLAADRVEAGGRLVEEEHARLVDQRRRRGRAAAACRPSRCRRGGRRRRRGRPARAARRPARLPSAPGSAVQRRLQADQLAAGHQRVERRLLQRDADRARAPPAASLTTSWPATWALPAGRAQQRGQHPHRRRLAGAVRAEEAVDLALRDLEVDAVDGVNAALERRAPALLPRSRARGQDRAREPASLDGGERGRRVDPPPLVGALQRLGGVEQQLVAPPGGVSCRPIGSPSGLQPDRHADRRHAGQVGDPALPRS